MNVSICFVCLGNICRSPTAEGVLRHRVAELGLSGSIEIDSAGTGNWHAGEPPDSRSVAAASRRGIRVAGVARQFESADWDRFDYVLAMDSSNYEDLKRRAPTKEHLAKLHLARSFDPASPRGASVPDPYYTSDGFEEVLELCDAACRGLLAHLSREHGIGP
jgi:protein-tyrosine phosphatase